MVKVTVNKNRIASNNKTIREKLTRDLLPPIRILHDDAQIEYVNKAVFEDPVGNLVAIVEYDPHKPLLPCGAKVVITFNTNLKVSKHG